MTIDDQHTALLKFKTELLAVFNRWLEESDLNELELAEAAVDTINTICGEQALDFEADQEMLDRIEEEEE